MNQISTPSAPHRSAETSLTDSDFAKIAAIAKARFGLDLQPSKKPLVHSRLAKRLRALGLARFNDYCQLLEQGKGSEEEAHLLSALTTNVTHFFRESHHFDFLAETVAPKLIDLAKAGRPVRLWSAACSAGQEAYSIAATLAAADPKIAQYDIRILATDIDPMMIRKAKIATYPQDQRQAIPARFAQAMVKPTADKTQFQIADHLVKMVTFAELNLIERWPMQRKFHVIFCRNAAIYFDKPTQATLWKDFANVMHDGGHLMIGHSERLSGDAEKQFRTAGITTYQKQSEGTANITQGIR